MSKFWIYKDVRGEYRWRLKAANGEIVAVSEGYTTKYNAKQSVLLVKKLAPSAEVYELD